MNLRALETGLMLALVLVALTPLAQAQGKPACNDGTDNDGDGLVDIDDPGCASKSDRDESNAAPAPACRDSIDNDQDGQVDYPADPGCSSSDDNDEANAPQPAEGKKPYLCFHEVCVPTAGPVLLDGWIELFSCFPLPQMIWHVEAWRDNNGNGLIDWQIDTLVREDDNPGSPCAQ